MIKKITNPKFTLKPVHAYIMALGLLVSTNSFSQTVENVFPTRVTSKVKVTVTGSGFTEANSVSINTIGISNVTVISPSEITFIISSTSTADLTGNLSVGGLDSSIAMDYIAPTSKTLQNTGGLTKISEIFTTYNGFWRSSQWQNSLEDQPNTNHDLLAFTYDGVTYSTGVDDAKLTSEGIDFTSQTFKAYSTNGISGTTNSSNFLAMGDMIDGEVNEGTSITSPEILGITAYEVTVDGKNGLDLGTGITNFNQSTNVSFFSDNGQAGAINDAIPDLLITQIAQPGGSDVYYYADTNGNVVGRPVKLAILNEGVGDGLLAKWRLDLYSFSHGIDFESATPVARSFTNNEERPIRMAALKLEDFEIDNTSISNINNINVVAGGTADIAFLAYNTAAFDIASPVVDQYPLSRKICKFPNNSTIVFQTEVSTTSSNQELTYQWYKYNSVIEGATTASYEIVNPVPEDLGTYKLRVSNGFGTTIIPVTLSQGGTPAVWNGSEFALPQDFIDSGISVNAADRHLIFAEDYNENADLEGCDCTVNAGKEVTIPSGFSLKLFDGLTVAPEVPAGMDGDGNVTAYVAAGTFTLENNASLVQTKPVTSNQNIGSILLKRTAENVHTNDFVYWSSPVEDFNLESISATPAFQYDVTASNPDGTQGNWVSASGVMTSGAGYSVQVAEASVPMFTTNFNGTPRNGSISVNVQKSTGGNQSLEENHRNFIGNPYPSAINADTFLSENSILEGNVRLWTHDTPMSNDQNESPFYQNVVYNHSDNYVTYNFTGATPANAFDGNIAAGQGFFVQVLETASAGDVNFNNAMRYDSNEDVYDNSGFYRANTSDQDKQLVWLSLVDENEMSASTLVGYVQDATNGKDRLYDAFFNRNPGMGIYSLIADSKMIIQGRALPFQDTDLVPLGIQLSQDGIYTINIDQWAGTLFVDQAQAVYLEDTVLDITHDLGQAPYTFSGIEGVINDRFILRFTNEELSVQDVISSETFAYIKNFELRLKSSENIEAYQVFDLNGKLILSDTLKVRNTQLSQVFQFARGVYVAVIQLANGTVVKKKLIN